MISAQYGQKIDSPKLEQLIWKIDFRIIIKNIRIIDPFAKRKLKLQTGKVFQES